MVLLFCVSLCVKECVKLGFNHLLRLWEMNSPIDKKEEKIMQENLLFNLSCVAIQGAQ